MTSAIANKNNDIDSRLLELSQATKRSRILMKNVSVSVKCAQIANNDFRDLEKYIYRNIK